MALDVVEVYDTIGMPWHVERAEALVES